MHPGNDKYGMYYLKQMNKTMKKLTPSEAPKQICATVLVLMIFSL